ncbi:hypothetical protein KC19_2G028200 [Ceratodon purpureus]|uniref:Uncharacterized protein n=1 Tax=Ceratodon purpureus TaxID=3225 RepID=A0A8T0IRI2_CERPU|nr:hypothetical protein KC19_2G028200 [Ceratodon purpureus]
MTTSIERGAPQVVFIPSNYEQSVGREAATKRAAVQSISKLPMFTGIPDQMRVQHGRACRVDNCGVENLEDEQEFGHPSASQSPKQKTH